MLIDVLSAGLPAETAPVLAEQHGDIHKIYVDQINLIMFGKIPDVKPLGHKMSREDQAKFVGVLNPESGFKSLSDILARIDEARTSLEATTKKIGSA